MRVRMYERDSYKVKGEVQLERAVGSRREGARGREREGEREWEREGERGRGREREGEGG